MFRRQESIVGWKPFSNGANVASARLRCRGPVATLRRAGFPVEVYDERNSHRYRLVILQKLLDERHQDLARHLQAQGTKVAFDLCDNYLYTADEDPALIARAERTRRMLDLADAVTVSTPTLASFMPRPTTIVRDGVEPRSGGRFLRSRRRRREGRLELVWFGTWGNPRISFGMRDLHVVRDDLERLAARIPTRLTVVSNSREAFKESIAPLKMPTRYVEWKGHEHLCRELIRHDACLIPVQDNPFTMCKSANRLALSLSLGLPVVASAIPSYEEFRGFCSLDDWEGGLRTVIAREDSLGARTEAGRDFVLNHHSMEHAAAEWERFIGGLLAPICEWKPSEGVKRDSRGQPVSAEPY